jgi:hypothetical protein
MPTLERLVKCDQHHTASSKSAPKVSSFRREERERRLHYQLSRPRHHVCAVSWNVQLRCYGATGARRRGGSNRTAVKPRTILTGEIHQVKGRQAYCEFWDDKGERFRGTCNLDVLSGVPPEPGSRFVFKAFDRFGHLLKVEPASRPDPRDDPKWREENRLAAESYKDFEHESH